LKLKKRHKEVLPTLPTCDIIEDGGLELCQNEEYAPLVQRNSSRGKRTKNTVVKNVAGGVKSITREEYRLIEPVHFAVGGSQLSMEPRNTVRGNVIGKQTVCSKGNGKRKIIEAG